MSYILEALKKADQERGIGAVPNLATPHEVKHPQSRSYRWLWVVVALLVVNIVLVGMLLKGRDAEVPVTAQAPLEQLSSPRNDQAAQPIQPGSEVSLGKVHAPEKSALPQSGQVSSAGQLVLLPEPAKPQNPSPSLPPEEEIEERAEAVATPQDISQLQSWYELPQELRNRLDLPRLDLHAYSEEPQNRFILVNLKKYREGERLESGLVLEEILPDGMVMSYRGERFLVEK
ncbi:general secretion pathway protein GspB [Pseudomonadota bacterium]